LILNAASLAILWGPLRGAIPGDSESIVIVLVAIVVGAFSGLLGSIAGPYLTHSLDSRQREQLRTERRREFLRDMIERKCAEVRSYCGSAYVVSKLIEAGATREEALARYKRLSRERLRPDPVVWKPHRINDKTLSDLAFELEVQDLTLAVSLEDIKNPLYANKEALEARLKLARESEGELEDLVAKIDLRLDELNW
jgi:hypothetical protein